MIKQKQALSARDSRAAKRGIAGAGRWRVPGLLCLGLALATLVLFLPSARHDFVNYDDRGYVTENYHVHEGLTWEGVRWAFTTYETGNWIPLTWLSHMTDCQLYGLRPAGHHLTNLLLHTANVLLLFLVLTRMTGARWRSAFVAALFAWHPLHVESVAWVSERKDVLSTFFFLLALAAYARYAEGRKKAAADGMPPAAGRQLPASYFCALSCFVLGLMSKPMVVTLPFVLLLLDYWPLQRLPLIRPNLQRANLLRLLAEKVPFFLLVIPASIVTLASQKSVGAVASLSSLPVGARLANALVAYARYLGKMLWPVDLAVLYPHPLHWPAGQVIAAGALLLGLTLWVARSIRSRPYLLIGWLWFLGTLVPVIGLVQAGAQAIADRYTYIPLIGPFIALTWWVADSLRLGPNPRRVLGGMGGVGVLAVLGGITHQQLSHWRDSEALFGHTLKVTRNNPIACNNRGFYLAEQGRLAEAIADFEAALRIDPNNADAHSNLGSALGRQGRVSEAATHYLAALQTNPDHAGALYNLGKACENAGQMKDAVDCYTRAIHSQPEYADAHNSLGVVLATEGKFQEAERHLRLAVRSKPSFAEALNNLGNVLTAQNRSAEAVAFFSAALRLKPDYLHAHSNLGVALVRLGRIAEALEHYDAVLRLNPDDVSVLSSKAWILSTQKEARFRNGTEAVRLAARAVTLTREQDAGALDALAAAHAEAGNFAEAVSLAQRAEQCAADAGQKELAAEIQQRRQLYQSGRGFREP